MPPCCGESRLQRFDISWRVYAFERGFLSEWGFTPIQRHVFKRIEHGLQAAGVLGVARRRRVAKHGWVREEDHGADVKAERAWRQSLHFMQKRRGERCQIAVPTHLGTTLCEA